MWNAAKQLIDQYGDKSTREENIYPTGKDVSIDFSLMDELAYSDGRKTESEALDNFTIQFITCTTGACKGYDGFFNVWKN